MEQNLNEQMSTVIQIIDDAVKTIKEQAERDLAELLRAKATMLELASRWRFNASTATTATTPPTPQPDSENWAGIASVVPFSPSRAA
jgi:hypothetical protein